MFYILQCKDIVPYMHMKAVAPLQPHLRLSISLGNGSFGGVLHPAAWGRIGPLLRVYSLDSTSHKVFLSKALQLYGDLYWPNSNLPQNAPFDVWIFCSFFEDPPPPHLCICDGFSDSRAAPIHHKITHSPLESGKCLNYYPYLLAHPSIYILFLLENMYDYCSRIPNRAKSN